MKHWLRLLLLLAAAFTLATLLEPAFRKWSDRRAAARSVLASILGDSRRLFANHFFVQADVYLHSGYYPSIFDESLAGETGIDEHEDERDHSAHKNPGECKHDFLGKPRNWIDRFGRNFFPSKHTHLGEKGAQAAQAREILPWIKFSAELDPHRAESFTVGAYWLRQMGRTNDALQFLREGLRSNPSHCEILYEMGLCYEERQDEALARNLWERAWRHWIDQESAKSEPDRLMAAQILTHLARLEVRAGRRDRGMAYLEELKKVSPQPAEIQKRIEEVRAGLPFDILAKPQSPSR